MAIGNRSQSFATFMILCRTSQPPHPPLSTPSLTPAWPPNSHILLPRNSLLPLSLRLPPPLDRHPHTTVTLRPPRNPPHPPPPIPRHNPTHPAHRHLRRPHRLLHQIVPPVRIERPLRRRQSGAIHVRRHRIRGKHRQGLARGE